MSDRDREVLQAIAANVYRLRTAAGFSMSELARRIGDYPDAIARIEAEKNVPGAGLLVRIADALDVTLNDLVAKSSHPSRKKLAHAS